MRGGDHHHRLRLPGLLAVHHLVQDAGRDLPFPPVWYPSRCSFGNYHVLFKDGDAATVWQQPGPRLGLHRFAMILGTHLRLQPRALQDRRREPRHVDHLAAHDAARSPSCSRCSSLYVWLGWVDTYVGLIVLYTAFTLPYVIWMMRGYIEDIPLELEESALVDGCTRWEVLWKVVVPMARSGLFATAVFTFVFAWNDFLFALVLTRTEVITYTGAGHALFRRPVQLLGQDRRHVGAGHIPVFFAVAADAALPGARHLDGRSQGLRRDVGPQDHQPPQALRRLPCGARASTSRSRRASSPCWSAPRAAASPPCCAPSRGSRRQAAGTIEIGGQDVTCGPATATSPWYSRTTRSTRLNVNDNVAFGLRSRKVPAGRGRASG